MVYGILDFVYYFIVSFVVAFLKLLQSSLKLSFDHQVRQYASPPLQQHDISMFISLFFYIIFSIYDILYFNFAIVVEYKDNICCLWPISFLFQQWWWWSNLGKQVVVSKQDSQYVKSILTILCDVESFTSVLICGT